jgi:hypothetical protein
VFDSAQKRVQKITNKDILKIFKQNNLGGLKMKKYKK